MIVGGATLLAVADMGSGGKLATTGEDGATHRMEVEVDWEENAVAVIVTAPLRIYVIALALVNRRRQTYWPLVKHIAP